MKPKDGVYAGRIVAIADFQNLSEGDEPLKAHIAKLIEQLAREYGLSVQEVQDDANAQHVFEEEEDE